MIILQDYAHMKFYLLFNWNLQIFINESELKNLIDLTLKNNIV